MMDLTNFKQRGGELSGKWGSNYTKICSLLETVDHLDTPSARL